MEKTVLISMPVEDLQNLIIDCVRAGLKYSPRPETKSRKSKQVTTEKTEPIKKEARNG